MGKSNFRLPSLYLTAPSLIVGGPTGGICTPDLGFVLPLTSARYALSSFFCSLLRKTPRSNGVTIQRQVKTSASLQTCLEVSHSDDSSTDATGRSDSRRNPVHASSKQTPALVDPKEIPRALDYRNLAVSNISRFRPPLSILSVIQLWAQSSPARVAVIL